MSQQIKNRRLESLDILRGADLFFLLFFQPVFMSFARTLDEPALAPLVNQFTHVHWEGFAFWDLIMPLFMFMAGVSMPFSLAKFIENGDKQKAWMRVLKRVLLLWILGAVVQGNLLSLDSNHIYIYSNTLQAIAAGYLITAFFYLCFKYKGVIIGMVTMFVVYLLPMTLFGDYTPDGNFAEYVDSTLLGRFRDATYFKDGEWIHAAHYHYTWIWSSLNFAVTVMLGFVTGDILKRYSNDVKKIVKLLAIIGTSLLIAGLLISPYVPIIKTIWSSSMTLFTGGICILLTLLFYYIIDYKGWGKALEWLKIYGTNSIAAYVIGEVVNFRCIAHSLTHGLQQFLGDYYNVWLTFANFLILFLLLRAMYKLKIFIKV